jgi:heat-inducible transcriptional repressor
VGPIAATTGDAAVDAVVASGVEALRSLGSAEGVDQLFVGGSSRMVAAFDAVETVRSVLSILEQQLVVVTLLRDILDTGLSVAIGTEHGMEPLASCAIVVMPVSVDGMERGTIGLLGPTRMNYPLALAAARVVGDRLGERLSEAGR